jgi:P27 family predicted phage terminase small subunit
LATQRASAVKELAPRVLELLPGKQSDIAVALGRRKNDGTVRRTLEHLATGGFAERVDGAWRRCQALPDPDVAYPDDLDQEARALYAKVLAYVRALPDELWDETMLPQALRYVRAAQQARDAAALVEAEGRYTTNSSGRVFRHPAVEDAIRFEKAAQDYASDLLLTPDARRRAGLKGDGGGGDPLDF